MKIVKHGKVLCTMVVIVFALSSCKNKSEQLVRSWKITDMKYSKKLPPEEQAKADATIKEMRQSFLITYNADGTYNTTIGEFALNGKWKLNWNSTVIKTTQDNGNAIDYKVTELTDSNLKFEVHDGKDEILFEMVPAESSK